MERPFNLDHPLFLLYVQTLRLIQYLKRRVIKYPRNSVRNAFPILSSDSYSKMSEISISNQQEFDEFAIACLGKRYFASINSLYLDGRWLTPVKQVLESNGTMIHSKSKRGLFVGGTDDTRKPKDFDWAEKYFSKVWVVNLSEESEFVKGLPLGLESARYGSGGRYSYFRRKRDSLEHNHSRPIRYLVAFNEETNPAVRSRARLAFEGVDGALIIPNRIPAAALHFLMTKTHFVICPSGNGMDSHRIWESAYLGAVPVILKEHAPGGSQLWPTLAVESWEDLKQISDDNWTIRKNQVFDDKTILHLERQIWSNFSVFEDAR